LRSRQCFEELFNYDVTADIVLQIVDQIAHESRRR
jgi:hypothetical protein